MEKYTKEVSIGSSIKTGKNKMILFAGPCAAESFDICIETGTKVKEICKKLDIEYIFKSSFDKANRTSAGSYRGPSREGGLEILARVKKELNVPIVTDV